MSRYKERQTARAQRQQAALVLQAHGALAQQPQSPSLLIPDSTDPILPIDLAPSPFPDESAPALATAAEVSESTVKTS